MMGAQHVLGEEARWASEQRFGDRNVIPPTHWLVRRLGELTGAHQGTRFPDRLISKSELGLNYSWVRSLIGLYDARSRQ
jgi:hypothetical protein